MTDPHAPLIDDGAVVWKGGEIVEIGRYGSVRQQYPDLVFRSLGDCLLMPGLINAHDHGRAIGTLRMGVPDNPLELWLPELYALPTVPPGLFAYYDGLLQLSSGITTTTHQHNPGDWARLGEELSETADGYEQAGIRACIGLPLSDRNDLSYGGDEPILELLPGELAAELRAARQERRKPGARELLAAGRELRALWRDRRMHWLCWGPVGPQWCSDELLLGIREVAQPGEPIHIHLAETPRQVEFGLRSYGMTPARHLAGIGFLDASVSCAHCVWLDDGDREALSRAGAVAVCNPSSNLRLQSGRADIRALREAGVTVALGLDGQTINDDQDMWAELRLAHSLSYAPGRLEPAPAAGTMLAMAGANAARAVGGPMPALGTLAAGGPADFIVLDLARITGPYLRDGVPLADLVLRRAKPEDVVAAVVDGRLRFDGRLEIARKLKDAGEAIAERLRGLASDGRTQVRTKALLAAMEQFYGSWRHGL